LRMARESDRRCDREREKGETTAQVHR
jgi:hypothetical protein